MIYVDTSVLVALHLREESSQAVLRWYSACKEELVCAVWCVTEFASALGIKQRTGRTTKTQGQEAWLRFEKFCASDLQLIPIGQPTFHRAALLTLDETSGLRSGDALHLASALDVKAKTIATLDTVLAKNSTRMKLKLALL